MVIVEASDMTHDQSQATESWTVYAETQTLVDYTQCHQDS